MSALEDRAAIPAAHEPERRAPLRSGQVAQLMTDFDEGFLSQKETERLLRNRFRESVLERIIRILKR